MAEMEIITDAKGRSLEVKALGILEELDLYEAAGTASEGSRRWLMMATLCACVRGIRKPDEGEMIPCVFPRTKDQIRKQVGLVDNHGLAAVVEWANANNGVDIDANMDVAKN